MKVLACGWRKWFRAKSARKREKNRGGEKGEPRSIVGKGNVDLTKLIFLEFVAAMVDLN